jgi:hypothetical protein
MSAITVKPDGTIVATVRITLKPGRDDTLIEMINRAPARCLAATIREAMRTGIMDSAELFKDEDLDLTSLGTEI